MEVQRLEVRTNEIDLRSELIRRISLGGRR